MDTMDDTKSVKVYQSDWEKIEELAEDGSNAAKIRKVVHMAETWQNHAGDVL